MDPISANAVKPGSFAPNVKTSEPASNKDAEAVAKVASVPLPRSDVKAASQDLKAATETAMKDIQHFISSQASSVRVTKDETSGHMVVKLVDPNTGEVIRTLPSEELLRLARSFEMLGNKMVHQTAWHPKSSLSIRVGIATHYPQQQTTNEVDDATFTRMREHWSDDGIVETAGVIPLFSFINRWNDSVATTLEYKVQIGWTPSSGLTGGQAPRLERLKRNGYHARCPVFPKIKQPFRLRGWLMCCQRGSSFTRARTGLRLLNIFFTPNPI